MDGMDDWMSNTAGTGPADGAFERFLTAALAAIITLVFSWRLLGEVSESEREEALRRHVAARGRNTAASLGISDEKLREVAVAFAQDRTEKLRAQTSAPEQASDGSSVDQSERGANKPADSAQANELSHELNSEDRDFIESLLKSSVDKSKPGTPQCNDFEGDSVTVPSLSETYVEYGHLLASQECKARASEADSEQQTRENQTDTRSRLTDFPTEESDLYVESNSDSRQTELAKLASYLLSTPQTLPQTEATTTTPEDSDEDDFEDYYHETSGPRVLDSDDETFYRTFLEPIQEELSGEDRGSSSDEWCPVDELEDSSDDSGASTPRPETEVEEPEPEIHKLITDTENIQSSSTNGTDLPLQMNRGSVCDKVSEDIVFKSDKPKENSEVNVRESSVFDNAQPSPEHKISVISEPEEWDFNDDSVSETSDDTVIMVFSNSEGNGINQKQNEIVFLDQQRYDGYRDMFLMEKIVDTDSDEDIMTTSNRYDSIRNNLTLIGSDDGESLSPCYDDYERGSWSDPDDNFRSIISHYNKNDNKVNFCDDSVSWNSKHSHKTDFDFGQSAPKGYGDAPVSNAAEISPVGFTFVEVKDSFTEFSLRNYVRDKDHFDPKSDSGIFTDGEDFAVSSNVNKSEYSENQIVPGSDSIQQQQQQDNVKKMNGIGFTERLENLTGDKPALSIDSTQLSENQFHSTTCGQTSVSLTKEITATELDIDRLESISSNSTDKLSNAEKDNITPCQENDSPDRYTERTSQESEQQKSLYDCLYVDTDNLINEAFSFHEDPTLLVCEDDTEAKNEQTMSASVEQKTLKQTEITCWSSHTEPLPDSILDIEKNYVQHDTDERARDAHNRVVRRVTDHLEKIRSSSPITTPSYYSDRQRRAHNEALVLDQIEIQNERPVEIIGYDDIQNILGNFDENQTLTTKSHSIDDLSHQRSANLSRHSLSATQIDPVFELADKHTDDLHYNDSYKSKVNTGVNDIGRESISQTTPSNETDRADSDNTIRGVCSDTSELTHSKTVNIVSSEQTGDNTNTITSVCNELTNSNTEDAVRSEQTGDKRNDRNSVILEESPVICLQSPSVTNNDIVFTESCVGDAVLDNTVQFARLESGSTVSLSTCVSNDLRRPGLESTSVQTGSDLPNSTTDTVAHIETGKNVTLPYRYTSPSDYKTLLKPTIQRRYTSVLQRPISTENVHVNCRLPDKPVPKIRRKILASRQRFLSEDNLLSANDSFEDPFSDHIATKRYHSTDKTPSPTSPSERQSYSVADISRLYASTLSEPRKPRPCIDQLHENCILSPERLALLRKRAFSTDSLPRRVSRQPSISSLAETDIDTGETSETSPFTETETDLDVDFGLQSPVEKTVSMMDLRTGRSRFAARKKASEERKKSKSLQQLETNIGSLETDIDAPFPDGTCVYRAPSEHELRVTKSLSKLNVPDWLRRSTVFRTGSHFILRRDSNASSISQWSSKSYGPLATTRDSSRASSCMTLSQPSPVVIKTRVSPISSSRLSSSPKIGSKPQLEPKRVTLPSAKFRQKEKPNGLMPIPIVPFEKLKEKFERKAAQNKKAIRPVPEKVVVETKIIVEPDRNAPPGILKQTSPTQANPPILEVPEPITDDLEPEPESPSRKVPPLTPIRMPPMPPPKITITADKPVSAKDKTSPNALEKSVRFSPVLHRIELAKGPNVIPPVSPEADYRPVNGGTNNKKPAIPPKPSKKILKSKSLDVESTPKSVKNQTKPVPPEKPSRIANLIRRFKGKDDHSFEVLGVGEEPNDNVAFQDVDTVFTLFQKPRSEAEQSTPETQDAASEPLHAGPPSQPVSSCSHGNEDKLHAHFTNTLNSPDRMPDHVITNTPSNVSLDEVLGSLLALNSRKITSANVEGENNDNASSISSESLSFETQV